MSNIVFLNLFATHTHTNTNCCICSGLIIVLLLGAVMCDWFATLLATRRAAHASHQPDDDATANTHTRGISSSHFP